MKTNVAWQTCTEDHIKKPEFDKLISCIDFIHGVVSCFDYRCKMHPFLSDLFNTVGNSCIIASDICLPKTGVKKGSIKVIYGTIYVFWHDIWV